VVQRSPLDQLETEVEDLVRRALGIDFQGARWGQELWEEIRERALVLEEMALYFGTGNLTTSIHAKRLTDAEVEPDIEPGFPEIGLAGSTEASECDLWRKPQIEDEVGNNMLSEQDPKLFAVYAAGSEVDLVRRHVAISQDNVSGQQRRSHQLRHPHRMVGGR
jgi:hypothetical protein